MTTSLLQVSPTLCTLLERLKRLWRDGWEAHHAFYIYELLPQLQSSPASSGIVEERRLMHEIRATATKEEWAQLPTILANLEVYQEYAAQVRQLEHLLKIHQFDDADALYSQIENYPVSDYATLRSLHWRAYGVKNTLEQIKSLLADFHFAEAADLYAQIADANVHPDYEQMRTEALSAFRRSLLTKLERLLHANAFVDADAYYATVAEYLPREQYDTLYQRYFAVQQREVMVTIVRILAEYRFEQADECYQRSRLFVDEQSYQELCSHYVAKQQREEVLRKVQARLRVLLQQGRFEEADTLVGQDAELPYDEYLVLKQWVVKEYFDERYGIKLNTEQAHVLSQPPATILVTARAGSGKTRTLTSKAALILAQKKYQPEQVLLLAFNRAAATMLRQTMEKAFGFSSFKTAFTFHSLAYHLVKHRRDRILTDEERLRFVQDVMWEVWDDRFAKGVYDYFRQETQETLDKADDMMPHSTLRGERVKSRGEKYIADFLFEHGITYAYERSYWWDGDSYSPDFTIFVEKQVVILEHWAIDPADPHATVPKEWEKSSQQYQTEIIRKRAYWQRENKALIETSTADLRGGREPFEALLKAKLEEQGVCCERLSVDQVQSRMRESKADVLARLFLQFIQRAKQQNLSAALLKTRLGYLVEDDRPKTFWRLASRVYEAYEQELAARGYIDFEDLLNRAVERIEDTKGAYSIHLGGHHEPRCEVRMDNLQWLLVDEFQDLSPAFYRLLDVLRKYNPMLKIFGVGDDWQAINGFAGSDLHYFRQFDSLFEAKSQANLLTNYRSSSAIVEVANHFMRGEGAPARARLDAIEGNVSINYLEDISIDLESAEITDDHYSDRCYRFADAGYDNGFYATKTLKCCHQIASDCSMLGKSLAILNRTNTIYGVLLRDFKSKLCELLPSSYQVGVGTVHGFKGQEADVVILLNVCSGSFPLIHSDTLLFLPFVRANENILDIAYAEEKRLFYVALTRAKERLWILTKRRRMSEFLKELPIFHNQPNAIKRHS